MKKINVKLIIGFICCSFLTEFVVAKDLEAIQTKIFKFDHSAFSRIPLLHNGRVKPLSTFAREHLLVLYGKKSLPESSAESWLAELLFTPWAASKRKVFKIQNPEVVDILGLKPSHLYSFFEVSKSIDGVLPLLNQIKKKPEEERTLIERQLVNLYMKTLVFFQLSRSLSLILHLFSLESSWSQIGITPGKKYSYLEMLKFRQKIKKEIQKIKWKNFNKLSSKEKELIALSYKMDLVSKDEDNDLFKIIPPLWKDNKELWRSPWELVKTGKGSPGSAHYLQSWVDLETAYRTQTNGKLATEKTYRESIKLSKGFVRPIILSMENMFNKVQFFQKSLLFYIIGFLLLCLSGILWKFVFKLSFVFVALGLFLHLTGIIFRILIMSRPPVATLYESIIFVGFIVVLFSLILEKIKEGSWGLLIGSAAGSVLHLIALKYQDIDSMTLLEPVLNTNFWLATHVICITVGYGFSIVCSLIAHIYIVLKCLGRKILLPIYKNITVAVYLALFFCLFGTILGGIWADQSWGRFWGWDPKENGALLIVIWFLVLLHGKLAGILKEISFSLGLTLTNIIVALSWFGVNLLGVGLHSYGFTSGLIWGFVLFCMAELTFFFSTLGILKWRER